MNQNTTHMQFLALMLAASGMAVAVSSLAQTNPAADSPGKPPTRLRLLLLTGHNNHHWHLTTPKLKTIFEATGRFQVDVQEHPEQLTAEVLRSYDALLSNWNSWDRKILPEPPPAPWPDSLRRAYLDFVGNGKGHVVIHAGSSSFYDWPEYQQLALASWKLGQTGHGPMHEFDVRIDQPDHPIMRGLRDIKTRDELWNRPGVQPGVTVLASSFSKRDAKDPGHFEPTAMVGQFGKGRSFTLLLGHDASAMNNPGFAALLVRGTEWAATGQVTIAPPSDLGPAASPNGPGPTDDRNRPGPKQKKEVEVR